ncbi:MAG: hypothetical protein A6F71_10275 [Cycloclasticus sp. symbiont of Poecilosclerida sp. M]|nr:MAG: hypothetical protein A6F71_10275 [Cycloclasticus sp. symbiont of Poecilosclerida sp. M]
MPLWQIMFHMTHPIPLDYDPAGVPTSLEIPAGNLSACFTSDSVIDDDIPLELEESFYLILDEEVIPDDPRVNVTGPMTRVIILDEDGE